MAGTRIAAWMVVGENDARASACECRVPDDGAQRESRTAPSPSWRDRCRQFSCLIDVRHPQALSSGIGLGKAAGEEVAGRRQSVQLERLFGTLIAHSALLCGTTSSARLEPCPVSTQISSTTEIVRRLVPAAAAD